MEMQAVDVVVNIFVCSDTFGQMGFVCNAVLLGAIRTLVRNLCIPFAQIIFCPKWYSDLSEQFPENV